MNWAKGQSQEKPVKTPLSSSRVITLGATIEVGGGRKRMVRLANFHHEKRRHMKNDSFFQPTNDALAVIDVNVLQSALT